MEYDDVEVADRSCGRLSSKMKNRGASLLKLVVFYLLHSIKRAEADLGVGPVCK